MQVTPEIYKDFVMTLFQRNEGDLSKDFAHTVLGMTTEADELADALDDEDEVNIIEELGDLLFFATAADAVLREHLQAMGVHAIPGHYGPSEFICPDKFTEFAWRVGGPGKTETVAHILRCLQNAAKKWVGYGAFPDRYVAVEHLDRVQHFMGHVMLHMEASILSAASARLPQKAAAANIRKLRHRYPGGFNLNDAENRDLEGERNALESPAP
jgi:hypothetical protein